MLPPPNKGGGNIPVPSASPLHGSNPERERGEAGRMRVLMYYPLGGRQKCQDRDPVRAGYDTLQFKEHITRGLKEARIMVRRLWVDHRLKEVHIYFFSIAQW